MKLDVSSLQTGDFVVKCMSVQGVLARRGVLELAIQTNVYGSLYVVFAGGGCLSTQSTPLVSALHPFNATRHLCSSITISLCP